MEHLSRCRYICLCHPAGRRPAIATFFTRLAAQSGEDAGIMEHLMSHPALGGRIAAACTAESENAKFRPLLTETEWDALRVICD
ncbi:hypothetical protein [Octadecabacter antarcticus]|uniref:hypothetical protein n=1 Tax=Octadecabacter antarcticus TaxID=1217908 RepID=UPI00118199FA|nr:hypothetical protein [Octadecabacter antarcticus]